jgi:hypothetical protein
MFKLNNIKQNVLTITIAALLTGCGGGGSADSTAIDSTISISKVVPGVQTIATPTEDSVIIEWVPFADTTLLVQYGTTKQYGSEVLVQEEGNVILYNLEAGTEYHYRIVSEDQNGRKVASGDNTFTTLGTSNQPIVTDPIVTNPTPTPVDPTATAGLINDDMYLDHEGYPHGVPSNYDFAQGPILRDAASAVGDFQATAGWGQVYEEINGNPSVNTRVELKNYKAYYLSKSDNKWHELMNVENITEGAGYVEDFSSDAVNPPSDIKRIEANGHVSTRPGSGYNYHFYPPRVSIDPNDIAQMAASCEAKLILANPNGVDDRHLAKFVLNIGMDVWRTIDAVFNYDYSNNHDIGMGRFKYITNEWRKFYFITDMPLAELQANTPPL